MILGFTLHEASHAFAAYRLGDDTAQRAGRLTLDPRVHLDPFGAILALLFGFGWAKPTPVSPWRLRYGPRVGNALVAVAGPLTNLLIAGLAAIPWQLGLLAGAPLFVQRLMLTIVAPVHGTITVNTFPGGTVFHVYLATYQNQGEIT
jgi:Zn-dependent protease